MMIDGLAGETRIVLKATYSPTVGSMFQPTGFPDLGPAEFERPDANGGTHKALLVESVQSLTNHLESTAWDHATERPAEVIGDLPYVEVRDKDGQGFLTSSRLEPHRLAGAYVRNSSLDGNGMVDVVTKRLGLQKGVPVDWRGVYAGIFGLDPLCLVHGVFFSDPKWRDFGNPKVRRAVTAVMEAHDVRPVVSGGVKRDDVNPTTGESRTSSEGYGFVPFGRTEYTAERIELGVAVDVEQIRGYGLSEAETNLLLAVALWEIRTLLDHPLRLRTACDLDLDRVEVRRPSGWELPSADDLASEIGDSGVTFDTALHSARFG
jgi:CRISPR-associated protein Csb1